VNEFTITETPSEEILRINPEVERRQKEKLNEAKKRRNQEEVAERLSAIKKAAKTTENLVPPIMDGVRSYATVGEISDTLRAVFGEYEERT